MANPVIIDFIVRGMPDITRALRGVEAATQAAERSSTRAAQQGTQQRVKLADQEAKQKIAAMLKADRWAQQAYDKGQRYAEQMMKRQVRAKEQEAKETIRIEERVARDVVRIRERASRDAARAAAKVEKEANRDAAQWVKKRQREKFTQERDEMRNRRAFAGAIAGAAGQGIMSGASRVYGATMGVANMVGQLGGGFSISDSVARNTRNAGETADLLNAGINPFSSNKVNAKRRDRSEVEGVFDSTTTQYGLSRESAIGGVRQFTKTTGDLDTGLKILPKLAELARATGTSLDTMSGAAGKVALNFDNVSDSGEKVEKIMQVMRVVSGQGKAGSVEVADMATQMGKLVATANKFDGDNVENLAKMGMLSQFAAGGGGAWSASSAATSVTSFGQVFSKPARQKAFEAAGIEIFSDKSHTKIKAPEQIIADAFEKTKGDQGKIGTLFGSAMSLRAINKFGGFYQNGYTDAGGKQLKGREAILSAAKEMTATQMTKADVTESAQNRMGELDAKMAIVQEQFDKAVRQKIIPALLKLVPEFEKLVPMIVDLNAQALPAFIDLIKTVGEFAEAHKGLIQDIASHPIGAIMAMEVTKSVSGALIGQGIKAIIEKSFGDAAMGNIISKVLGSQLGQAGLIVGAASIAIASGMIAIDNEYKKGDKLREDTNADATAAAGIAARIRNGTATDEDRAKAQGLVTKLGADQQAVANDHNNPGFWKSAGRGIGSVFAPGATAEADANEKAQAQRQVDSLAKTMAELSAAIKNNTAAVGSSGAKSGTNGPARGKSMTERN